MKSRNAAADDPRAEPREPSPVSEVRATERETFLALLPEAMALRARSSDDDSGSFAERARLIVSLGRPRTCVPGLAAYALGYSYTAGDAPPAQLALGGLLALLIGFSANLHNSATDLDEDSRNLPGRVYLVSKLGYRSLMKACRMICAFMLCGAALEGTHFFVFMALAVVGLHQYSAPPVRSKGRPLLGLWVFAQAVVFPFLFGWTTSPGAMLSTLLSWIAGPLTGRFPPPEMSFRSYRYLGMWAFLTLWFMAKGAFKNVPDFEGDRAASVRTSATWFHTRRAAALAAVAATLSAYASLAGLVALGLEKPRVLFALLWLLPVAWNSARLIRAREGGEANDVLKTDMLISSGFIGSLLLIVAPTPSSMVFALTGACLLFGSDLFGLDSRRRIDATSR